MNKEDFQSSPSLFLEERIREHVRNSPLNRLQHLDGAPMFEEPLIGFANGDDPIFEEYKTIVGDFHLTPREVLSKHLAQVLGVNRQTLPHVSTISYALPIAKTTRLINRKETQCGSLRWNHTRWYGQEFIFELSQYVVHLLKELGQSAVDPEQTPLFSPRMLPNGLASTWSQRHIAFAAGLGTFSLSDGFITPKGIAVRLGSVVTNLELPPTQRLYSNHLANCTFYVDGSCRRCIERCPGSAITEIGHDKEKCRVILYEQQKPWLDGAHGSGYVGEYAGCGLCQTAVPCEERIPPLAETPCTSGRHGENVTKEVRKSHMLFLGCVL